MRIGNYLYFSPNYKFVDLKWDDRDCLISAFQERVSEYYLNPAQILNERELAFAAGVVLATTIDFLAGMSDNTRGTRKRIVNWLVKNIPQFGTKDPDDRSRNLAERFSAEFRNGLVHEGRIKNGGQFSYDFAELVKPVESVLIINPKLLWDHVDQSFSQYVSVLKSDEFAFRSFRRALVRSFQKDIKVAGR